MLSGFSVLLFFKQKSMTPSFFSMFSRWVGRSGGWEGLLLGTQDCFHKHFSVLFFFSENKPTIISGYRYGNRGNPSLRVLWYGLNQIQKLVTFWLRKNKKQRKHLLVKSVRQTAFNWSLYFFLSFFLNIVVFIYFFIFVCFIVLWSK